MAKYTINDTTLVAIADAIRAKSGTTGGIDPADMAALIAAIESGGDLGEVFGAKFATGSFVLAENTTSVIDIDYGGIFTEIPYFMFAFEATNFSGGTPNRFYCQMVGHQKSNDAKGTADSYGYKICIDENRRITTLVYGWSSSFTKDKGLVLFNGTYSGVAGVQYQWIAFGE